MLRCIVIHVNIWQPNLVIMAELILDEQLGGIVTSIVCAIQIPVPTYYYCYYYYQRKLLGWHKIKRLQGHLTMSDNVTVQTNLLSY